ncbi:MAG: tetratricopeptide repeat protein [Desulfitobacteriaceae bacterium]|nr:tetratricopeptide repeat protein [Desulfitobacteriaceae bacterium]MDD4347156.1 tetratricopeptide repeat protein [Desulfitobacteriaceae bacterium]MDD4401710.1 tetratricopeptide repeat protein [Desulfitobacteriaceae bacterium]
MPNPLTSSIKSKILTELNENFSAWWLKFQTLRYKLFGRIDEAIAYTVQLLKYELPEIRLNEVRFLIKVKAYNEARDYLEMTNCSNKDNQAEIKILYAKCYLGLGLCAKAKAAIRDALEIEPEKAEYWNLMADCLLEQGDWQAAIGALDNSMKAAPKQAETIFRMGMVYAYHEKIHEALRCFHGCCQLRPRCAQYWEMKAEMHLLLGQIQQASRGYEKAFRFAVQPELAVRLAYCYINLGKIKKGIKYYELVLKHEPDHYDALCNLAAVYQNQDRSIEALNLLERAYRIYPNDAILLNNMAYTLVHLGRTRKAMDTYHSALKLDPDNLQIMYNLSVCLVQKGKCEEGIESLNKVLEINPQHSESWALLGNIYDKMAQHDIAIDCYNRSLNLAS